MAINKSVPRNHLCDAHGWTTIHVLQKQLSICTHTVVSGKIQIQKGPAFFRNVQSFVDYSMEKSIRYNFLIDLENILHKLSSDYSFNMCFSRRFPYIDGPSFPPYKPLQNIHF